MAVEELQVFGAIVIGPAPDTFDSILQVVEQCESPVQDPPGTLLVHKLNRFINRWHILRETDISCF